MANFRARPSTGLLYFDFYYKGVRCREYTALTDTAANRKKMAAMWEKVETEISLGTFKYETYFPSSKLVARFAAPAGTAVQVTVAVADTPLFRDFFETWKGEKRIEWRVSYRENIDVIGNAHLLPYFGDKALGAIDRAMVLAFRSACGETITREDGSEKTRSAATINRVMTVFSQIMQEASVRHGINNPCKGIKRLKTKKIDIQPFGIDQVRTMIATIRPDYRNYLTVRFFTGMRSGEVHGLKWKHIDFEKRQILVRETFQKGRTEYTKTDGSQREIDMAQPVYEALIAQKPEGVDEEAYVFCSVNGLPIDNKNFTNRVWLPLLRHLEYKRRRPYQMRHTCATLWLAAGENPEWIARQLGHTSTEMLFKTYSRFIPNLTRKDGSAFNQLISAALNGGVSQTNPITNNQEAPHVPSA